MLERLVIKSNGYVYVHHSGLASRMQFMGMTEESYKKAKGSYKVLCFVCIKDSYEDAEVIIREDYQSGKDYGLDLMNISDHKSIDKSLDCARNFFENVVVNCPIFKNTRNSYYFVDLDTGKGVRLYGNDDLDCYPKTEVTLGRDMCIADCIEGTVIDFRRIINDFVGGKRKVIPVKNLCRNSYIWSSKYCRILISENGEYSMIGLFSAVNVDWIPDIKIVEDILKKDTDIVYEPNETAYWL